MPTKSKKETKDSADQAYCMKCKGKVTPKDFKKTTSDKGRCMMRGKCPKCDTNVVRFC